MDEKNRVLKEYHTDGYSADFFYDNSVGDGYYPVEIEDSEGIVQKIKYKGKSLEAISYYEDGIKVGTKGYKTVLEDSMEMQSLDSKVLTNSTDYSVFYVYHSDGTKTNMSKLISNGNFVRGSSSASQTQIQTLLKNNGSPLKDYITVYKCNSSGTIYNTGVTILPSQVIYNASVDYSISPKVILATMQKESSLVSSVHAGDSLSSRCFYFCMGAGSVSDPDQTGFVNQVRLGAKTLHNWYITGTSYTYPYKYSNSGFYAYHGYGYTGVEHSIWCDNAATFSLYKYTNYTIVNNSSPHTANELFRDLLSGNLLSGISY